MFLLPVGQDLWTNPFEEGENDMILMVMGPINWVWIHKGVIESNAFLYLIKTSN